jgi:hypothetical protein
MCAHPVPIRSSSLIHVSIWILCSAIVSLVAFAPPTARAGGQGSDVPPVPLPVLPTELRIASQVKMVCVSDPGIVCQAPFLDAQPDATNTDGATFRSASCGGSPYGACRPDYIAGTDITGELVIDWPITRLPNVPECGSSPDYEICHDGHIELNVTAPGVTVSNPLVELNSIDMNGEECRCIGDFDTESEFDGEIIEQFWRTRNIGAPCDIALEYATLVPRRQILAIGQEAFPNLLCNADANGRCTIDPVPVLIEPDGSLTKGCGTAPSNTFAIRFAKRNQPVTFVRKDLPVAPYAVADVDADMSSDIVENDAEINYINRGNNLFSQESSGLPNINFSSAAVSDWTDDGDADVVARLGSNVVVYPGDGSGTFSDASSFVAGASSGSLVETEDLNDDGLPDAVSSSFNSTTVVWNQTGGPVAPTTESASLETFDTADLDTDLDPDLVGGIDGATTELAWASNTGPGGFTAQSLVTVPTSYDELGTLLDDQVAKALACNEFGAASDCCTDHGGLGCSDAVCEAAVCDDDPSCCDTSWNEFCRQSALDLCGVCRPPEVPDCCVPHATGGCDVPTCEDIICQGFFSYCCTNEWDAGCVNLASGLCNECHDYVVVCDVSVRDVAGADTDADGDTDLVASVYVDVDLRHNKQNRSAEAGYLVVLPNLQVDDPQSAGGQPLFDPGVAPWQLLGRVGALRDGNGSSRFEMLDLDGDMDPDAVAAGIWYRNDGGTFTGPYGMGLGATGDSCGVDGLVGYWPFNGNADDASGCGHDGVVTGAVLAPGESGTPDTAYLFDGVDDVIDFGSSPLLDAKLPATITFRVRHDCASKNCRVFSNDRTASVYSGLFVDLLSGAVRVSQGDGGGATSADRRSFTTSVTLSANVWYDVAIVVWALNSASIYIDGVRDDSTSFTGTGTTMTYLGNDAFAGNLVPASSALDGELDDLRLYDRALTEAEIQALLAGDVAISIPPIDPEEEIAVGSLFVLDTDDDGDIDVASTDVIWEQVPEPGFAALLASGIAMLLVLDRRRRRR